MDSGTLKEIDSVFTALVKIKDFEYTYNKLYVFLNKSNFIDNIERMENNKNVNSYTIFINKQLNNGVKLKDVLELWEKHKLSNIL
tara:strand:- start:5793 stop:6047 length:255 start_codon:yes stop_codon:yes gene_type:complete